LNKLPGARLEVTAHAKPREPLAPVAVCLTNVGDSIAFGVEVTAASRDTCRSLVPSFWSDNFVTLLPGEQRVLTVTVDRPVDSIQWRAQGWNREATMYDGEDRSA
jgi:exo-1,4-beta-D-glucosaminidase